MAANWAENVLSNCLGLQTGERVVVLVDPPLAHAAALLEAEGRTLGAGIVTTHELRLHTGPLTVVSQDLLRRVASADVIVSLLSTLALEREEPAVRAAMAAFREAGHGRWAFGAWIDDETLSTDLMADYSEVARIAGALRSQLAAADLIHITSDRGTDLRLRRGGRPAHADTGILTEPGAFGNLPAGEAYCAPLEESAEGRLVVDLCLGDLQLDAPVTLTFRAGRAVGVEGGAAAAALKLRLGADPRAWTVGEFGIGANPAVRVRGRVTSDEKAWGTVHVALGANVAFGGRNDARTHYDCVLDRPRVWLDGAPLAIG